MMKYIYKKFTPLYQIIRRILTKKPENYVSDFYLHKYVVHLVHKTEEKK